MKKLLAILAISTITVVPSITLISCFNETNPVYFTFDEKDPVKSILNATAGKDFVLSKSDFCNEPSNKSIKDENTTSVMDTIMDTIIFQIANSFTPRKEADKAFKWLNKKENKDKLELTNGLDIVDESNIVDQTNVYLQEKKEGEQNLFQRIHFKIKEGNSFYWLYKNFGSDYFVKGLGNVYGGKIGIPGYLGANWYKIEQMEDGVEKDTLKANVNMLINELIISQLLNNLRQNEEVIWNDKMYNLNSSNIVMHSVEDKPSTIKYFKKGDIDSITSFVMMSTANTLPSYNGFIDELMKKFVIVNGNAITFTAQKINTNLFNSHLDPSEEPATDDKFTLDIVSV